MLLGALDGFRFSPDERLNVVAAGKAGQRMADAFLERHGATVREMVVANGGHPLPDAASFESGARALALADRNRERGETLVVLLSGGASAMLAAPADGVTLERKVAVTRELLRSGRPIAEMNAIRRQLSAIKGGKLAARAGRSVTLAISDVHAPIEDDPSVIGSGPTTLDAPSPGVDARFVLVGSRRDAMRGAREAAERLGYTVRVIAAPILGEARSAAHFFSAQMTSAASHPGASASADLEVSASPSDREVSASPSDREVSASRSDREVSASSSHCVVSAFRRNRPLCLITSGETTVTLPDGAHGRGGRNQELALAFALEPSLPEAYAFASIGTDGIDGPTDAAGAIVDGSTLRRAREQGLDAAAALQAHDSYSFFRALGDLVITGPSGTNVGDLQVLVVPAAED